MAHITLSIPEDLYKLMRKYKEVNWSEIARKAIIEKLLALKAVEEGLTREELVILLDVTGRRFITESYDYAKELDFLRKIKEREERRIRYLKRLEES
ncbi:MAG: hypothetical protein DRJ47_05395 [Thermoprotei archaeon]|nr:MAG: hypothetical protein DRJ47_05395 [Thermoprotei archaeon]